MSEIPSSTIAAYLETDYCVFSELPFVLRIGIVSEPLARLYRQHHADCAAFVTACNPHSQDIGEAANAPRQVLLADELERRALIFFGGEGKHPDGSWPAEPSFLVMGLDREGAVELGRRYQQNAVVWCGADAVPELLLLHYV